MISFEQIKKYCKIACVLVFFLTALICITNLSTCKRDDTNDSNVIFKVDTLYLFDTIRIEKPVPKIIKKIDTFLVQVKDTIKLKDTLYIALSREQITYEDKNYQAWISGYQPQLDSIHIFRNTQQIINSTTIQNKLQKNRWSIGIHAGYGLTSRQNIIKPTPYIGFGLSYRLFMF